MSSERLVMTNDTQDTGEDIKIQILNKKVHGGRVAN